MTMRRLAMTCIILASLVFVCQAQKGVLFPDLHGEVLSGGTIDLPGEAREKPLIIGLAWSQKAEKDLKTWYTPMHDTFVLKRGIMDVMYNVDLYMIPMFTGMKKVVYETSIKKMREENRKDLFPHIVFYRGELEPYAQVLRMTDKHLPYLFVVDATGKVIYATSGAFNERKKDAIESALEDLMD